MRLERRRLTARDTDHEVLWLWVGAAGAIVAAAASWGVVEWPRLLCPLKEVTGWPCPTCGATRALFALVRGEFVAALALNPAVVALAALYAVFALYAGVTLAGGLPRLRLVPGAGDRRSARWLVGGATLGTWLYLLAAGR